MPLEDATRSSTSDPLSSLFHSSPHRNKCSLPLLHAWRQIAAQLARDSVVHVFEISRHYTSFVLFAFQEKIGQSFHPLKLFFSLVFVELLFLS